MHIREATVTSIIIIIVLLKAINSLNSIWWHKDITKKQKIMYLSNNNSEHFDVWSRSMANTYQRNKQNFIYRNGCGKEISKKIKNRKNKK